MEQITQPKIPLATRILNQSENGAFKDISFSEEHVFFGKHLTEKIEEAAKLGFKQARLGYPVPKEYKDFLISEGFLIEERFGFWLEKLSFPSMLGVGCVFAHKYGKYYISWGKILEVEESSNWPFKSEKDRDDAAEKAEKEKYEEFKKEHEKLRKEWEDTRSELRENLKARPKSLLERIFNP